jgi:DNA-binding transcriptional LysR family regulator
MNMATLKQFNYLIRIVEEGGFIAAAEKLFIAQSALSRQIKLLEEEIGFEIFDRSDKKIKLTKAGQFFYLQVKNNLLNLNHIIENSREISSGLHRLIKVAHSSTISMSLEKVQLFDQVAKQQSINFEINNLSSEDQVLELLKGNIDIGFFRPPILNSLDGLTAVKLYDEALFVAVHQHHHLAKATTVKIQQLIDEDFVSTPHAERGGLSYLVSNICLSAGFAPKKARIQSRKVSQLQLVAANIGICIVPAEFKNIVPEQVRLIALDIELVRSDVVMAWNSHADDAVVKCAKELVKCFQQ